MQMIPGLVLQHLHNPAQLEELFVKYIQKAGLTIQSSKTIAGVAYYHKKDVSALTAGTSFFTGTLDPDLTNMPGNDFIRPQDEHALIWGIRIQSVAGSTEDLWIPGAVDAWINNLDMEIKTNSEVKLTEYPLLESLSGLTVRDDGIIPLQEPIFWAGQQRFEIEMTNKQNFAAPQNLAMCVELLGLGLV